VYLKPLREGKEEVSDTESCATYKKTTRHPESKKSSERKSESINRKKAIRGRREETGGSCPRHFS